MFKHFLIALKIRQIVLESGNKLSTLFRGVYK